jgi:ABC-type nitrate/sulfonate/bicarbonate transport system substrate-binding protein
MNSLSANYARQPSSIKKIFRATAITVLHLLLLAPGASAQLARLSVAYTGVGPTHLPVWIAKETGIFAKNGLDVQIIRAQAATATMSLISGELGFIQAAAPAVVLSSLGGSGTVYVASGYVGLDYWLVSLPQIKNGEQLKGGIIGVSGLTGASFTATQLALKKLGLNPGKDVSIIGVGGTPERLAALRSGRIQATLLNPPTIFLAERQGFHVLADVSNLPFQNNGVVSTKKFIREQQNIVRRYVKSQVEAVHIMKTDRTTGLKVFAKHLAGGRDADPQITQKSYDVSITDDKFPRNQYPSLDGIKLVIDSLGERGKDAKPADFVDATFVRELEDSGFTRDLYKQR